MFETLRNLLSDYYMLYLKAQNYHWNFEGQDFFVWHEQFEEQYKDFSEAIDTTAELIRGLGYKAPANFETYIKYTSLKQGNEEYSSKEMLEDITHDHEKILITLQNVLQVAGENKDEVVIDFVVQRMTYHRKTLWMLRSSQT
jgi:starvation-inducible DNA-binding protein